MTKKEKKNLLSELNNNNRKKNGLSERSDSDQGGWKQARCRDSFGGEGWMIMMMMTF